MNWKSDFWDKHDHYYFISYAFSNVRNSGGANSIMNVKNVGCAKVEDI